MWLRTGFVTQRPCSVNTVFARSIPVGNLDFVGSQLDAERLERPALARSVHLTDLNVPVAGSDRSFVISYGYGCPAAQ